MSKKTLIIIISIILLVFLGILIGILIYRKNHPIKTTNNTKYEYANNDIYNDIPIEDAILATTSDSQPELKRNNELTYDNIEYTNCDLLTDHQYEKRDQFFRLVDGYVKNYREIKDQNIKSINILDSSNTSDTNIYATIIYENNSTEDIVITYDDKYNCRYLRCVSLEMWNEIRYEDSPAEE